MELKDVLKFLERDVSFVGWRDSNPDFFLAHAFVMVGVGEWQIVFFSLKKERMATFFVNSSGIRVVQDQEVLKSGGEIVKLDRDKVLISCESAVGIANACLKKEYGSIPVVKTFFVIQQMNGVQVYNVTFFLQSFKTVNVHVSSFDGKILSHSEGVLATFG